MDFLAFVRLIRGACVRQRLRSKRASPQQRQTCERVPNSGPAPPDLARGLLAPPLTYHAHSMCNTPIYFWNIQMQHLQHTKRRQMKYLKHASETLIKTLENHSNITQRPVKTLANICNICVKHIQHSDKRTCNIRLKNKWNIGNKHLQHKCTTIATYATS